MSWKILKPCFEMFNLGLQPEARVVAQGRPNFGAYPPWCERWHFRGQRVNVPK